MLPMNHSPIPMRNDLEANESKGFAIQHRRIRVGCILLLDTEFSEKFCDIHNVILNNNKLCVCFSLKSSRSDIIYMHSICFSTETVETKTMRKFRSLKVLEKYTKGNLSVDICASRLQAGNDAYDNIVDYLEEIVDLVNSEGA